MKKVSFIKAMCAFIVTAAAIAVIGGNLNPNNTPSPTMRTLDELYKNIQPGLPSDWKPYPTEPQSTGAGSIHLTIAGANPIQGGCTAERKEGTIVVTGLGHQVMTPIDSATGLPTGYRKHSLLTITKYIDRASPLLYRAQSENRMMDLTFRFYRDRQGEEEHYYSIFLEDARAASIRTAYPNIEEISFVYETIRWIAVRDGIEFADSWQVDPM